MDCLRPVRWAVVAGALELGEGGGLVGEGDGLMIRGSDHHGESEKARSGVGRAFVVSGLEVIRQPQRPCGGEPKRTRRGPSGQVGQHPRWGLERRQL